MNFARKVIATQECDFLVLDEILGLFDYGLVTTEAVADILKKGENMHIVLTGDKLPVQLRPYVDTVTTLTLEEISKQNTINITEE
jgi:cob(I)alamin adenosyltransferase